MDTIMDKKRRVQFDFSGEALEEIEELQRQTGFSSRADLIRHALRLFQWAFDETQNQGSKILIEKNGQVREVMFPFWRRTRREVGPESPEEEVVGANPTGFGRRL